MLHLAFNTTLPIFALIGLGWLSRRMGWLRPGDERVLNAYVYYFALPALFLADLSEMRLGPENLRFIAAGILPVLAIAVLFPLVRYILWFSKDMLHLLLLSTAFGSLAFFGIPYINFAFPGGAEHLATLSAAAISVPSVIISLVVLELRRHEASGAAGGIQTVSLRLAQNPLILSITGGVLLSLLGLTIPSQVLRPLHMLGGTTVTMALFLLGVFLYGRRYTHLPLALALSLTRAVLLPAIGLLVCLFLGVTGLDRAVIVLMHAMPVAIAMIVLSERYDFHKETIASLVLISSLGSALTLNVWLWLLRP